MVERIEMMDNFLINMTLATCDGWIMDNLPIIMTLGTPDPYLGCGRPLQRDGAAYSSHSTSILRNYQRMWVEYCLGRFIIDESSTKMKKRKTH